MIKPEFFFKQLFLLLFILVTCFFSFSTASASNYTIAVLDLNILVGIPASYQTLLSDRLRHEIYNTGDFTVVERNDMETILSEQGFQLTGCTSDQCAVEVGRILGVEKMVAGSVGKIGSTYSMILRMIDVNTAIINHSVKVDKRCTIDKFHIECLEKAAKQLANKCRKEMEAEFEIQNYASNDYTPEPIRRTQDKTPIVKPSTQSKDKKTSSDASKTSDNDGPYFPKLKAKGNLHSLPNKNSSVIKDNEINADEKRKEITNKVNTIEIKDEIYTPDDNFSISAGSGALYGRYGGKIERRHKRVALFFSAGELSGTIDEIYVEPEVIMNFGMRYYVPSDLDSYTNYYLDIAYGTIGVAVREWFEYDTVYHDINHYKDQHKLNGPSGTLGWCLGGVKGGFKIDVGIGIAVTTNSPEWLDKPDIFFTYGGGIGWSF